MMDRAGAAGGEWVVAMATRVDRRCTRAVPVTAIEPAALRRERAIVVAGGIHIAAEYVVDLQEALDTLATLATEKGARLPRRIARLRAEVGQIGTRANTRAAARKVTQELEAAHAELGLIDVAAAAKRLGLREDSVRDLCRRNKLAAMRPDGRRWWISEASVDQRARKKGP